MSGRFAGRRGGEDVRLFFYDIATQAGGAIGQVVGFAVVLAGNAHDGEIEATRQFPADPVQGIKAWAAADIFTAHLANDDVGIGIHTEGAGVTGVSALQSFEKGGVFGDVIVLKSDPLADADAATFGAFDNHADARGARTAMGTAVYIGDQL